MKALQSWICYEQTQSVLQLQKIESVLTGTCPVRQLISECAEIQWERHCRSCQHERSVLQQMQDNPPQTHTHTHTHTAAHTHTKAGFTIELSQKLLRTTEKRIAPFHLRINEPEAIIRQNCINVRRKITPESSVPKLKRKHLLCNLHVY